MSASERSTRISPLVLVSLAILVCTAVGWLGYAGAMRVLEHRERVLARRDVADYVEKHAADIREFQRDPLVKKLNIGPLPGDDTRVRVAFEVADIPTFRLLEERFADVDLERFSPVWETKVQDQGGLSREPHVIVLAAGAFRGYATRSTLSGGVAGILGGTLFSLLWLWHHRRSSVRQARQIEQKS